MDFNKYCYWPVLKTKDAELRGISNLTKEISNEILPIYEITKSRISKKNPIGDISKRIEQIAEIQGKRPFILDVSTDPSQQNSQIEDLLKPNNGYYLWAETISAYPDLKIIPTIHINYESDEDLTNTELFVRRISESFKYLALRLPATLDIDTYTEILEAIFNNIGKSKLILLLDEECIRARSNKEPIDNIANAYASAYDSIKSISFANELIKEIVCICGSFPQSPAQVGGDGERGSFDILEHKIFSLLKPNFPELKFGDYASVNIKQKEMRGGTFIPRIDFCTEDKFYYHRYTRQNGSYPRCAKEVMNNSFYKSQNTWGDEEIGSAASDSPSGISPSFWISVRINLYMTSRVSIFRHSRP